MENVQIEVKKREEIGKKLSGLRKLGLIPAVVYGKKLKAMSVVVDCKSFTKLVLQSDAGRNSIISLAIDKGAAIPVLTHAIQRNATTDQILHIDFLNIVMDEVLRTKVPVELVGIPAGVKEEGGILIQGIRELEVECLPSDIPEKYEIDVSILKINDSLHVSDLVKIEKVKIMTNQSEMIANCAPPAKEEEVAAPVPTPGEVPVTAQGEAPVEGAKAAEPAAPAVKPAQAGKPATVGKPEKAAK